LQQQGNDWKLGGFYAKPAQISGHDGNWFASRAREFKTKGQLHNSWFYLARPGAAGPGPLHGYPPSLTGCDEMQAQKPATCRRSISRQAARPIESPICFNSGGPTSI
jgi:hypothetical protein